MSPNPFGACGDQIGCRSCRSSGIDAALASRRVERAQTATSQSCGVRNFRAFAVHASGRSIERGGYRAQIAVGVAEHARDALDRRRRRLIAHEMRDELRREERRR